MTSIMWAFETQNIFDKIQNIRASSEAIFSLKTKIVVPERPARDALVLEFKAHPHKKGFSSLEGQARMLHDLASIELQAMELGLRTLVEFPEAPAAFREELWAVTLSESQHLEMCLIEIEKLGFKWGDWPINCGLWQTVSVNDSLLDRVLIVHRYLEGSGLDAGDTLLRRLAGVQATSVSRIVKIINDEEIDHVLFGARWYQALCLEKKLNPVDDFTIRMNRLRTILPKRVGAINRELRARAGFSALEIQYLERLRDSFLDKESTWKKDGSL